MALRIVEDDRHEFKVDGSVIHYTKVGWGELREIRESVRDKDTLRIAEGDVEERLLLKHVLGWENILNRAGEPVPFSHNFLLRLPPMVIDVLVAAIYAAAREESEKQGESEGSSST